MIDCQDKPAQKHGFSQGWEEVCTPAHPSGRWGGVGMTGRNQGITEGPGQRKSGDPAWKLSSNSKVLASDHRFPSYLCQLLYKEGNSAPDTHILVKFLSKMTIQLNGSTVSATAWKFFFLISQQSYNSVLLTKYSPALLEGVCSVRSVFKEVLSLVVSIWTFLFDWFSDCATFNTHLSANSPPFSVPHHFSK